MKYITLGKTGIKTNKNAFGALPIQRVTIEYAGMLLKKAYNAGFTFFDTARSYSNSEEKISLALSDVRKDIVIATKTPSTTVEGFWKDLETSLSLLKTDYIDIYQFHNPSFCPKTNDGTGLYEAMVEARDLGKIRFIGITNHSLKVAEEAVHSGLYDTLQFPFSYLASDKDISLINLCRELNIGVIAMKSLSGGLITKSNAAYAWLDQFDNVLPIWGIQRESELDEFISYMDNPPVLNEEIQSIIKKDKEELSGNFCRGCGYCMPCTVGIQINNAARMIQLIRRSPSASWLSEGGQKMMLNIENCIECGECRKKCPYGLDTPNLLKKNLEDYKNILSGRITV
ncbi:MAG: aldo/keto reductase [Oscillospiraceae bacterium]|nr:aldo/keto reductase [Oscillospiraceae bacterium]